MAMRAVDLNLFVNAMSKAHNDAAKTPSAFTSFFGGLLKGIDDQQKYDSEEQQQEIRANTIAQIPVQNRIQEAAALTGEANVAAYKQDPQGFVDAQVAKQQAIIAEQKRAAALQQQEAKFMETMKSGSSYDKYTAMTSGENTELFAAKPNTYIAGKASAGSWEPEHTKAFHRSLQIGRVEAGIKDEKAYAQEYLTKNSAALKGDPEFAGLTTELGSNTDDMLRYGRIETITRPKQKAIQIKEDVIDPKTGKARVDPNTGKTIRVPVHDADGNPTFKTDPKTGGLMMGPSDDENAGTEKINVFKYNDPVTGVEETRELKDGSKLGDTFPAHQKNWNMIHDITPGNPGSEATAEEESRKNKEARDESIAREKALHDASEKDKQAGIARYEQGLKGEVVRKGPEAQQTPAPSAAPTAAPNVVTPLSKQEAVVPRAASAPAARTPITPEMDVAIKKKQELKSKAGGYIQRHNPDFKPISLTGQSAGAFYIPDNIEVKTSVSAYNSQVAQRVNSHPALKNSSALVKAVASVESRGIDDATSPTGVVGLMQVTAATTQEVIPGRNDRTNPYQSVLAGTLYLERQMKNFRDPMISLLAYNAGPGTAARAVRLAQEKYGVTTWDALQRVIPQAVRMSFPNLGETALKGKIKEALEYPEKVASYVPAFVTNQNDMRVVDSMKENKVLDYKINEAPKEQRYPEERRLPANYSTA